MKTIIEMAREAGMDELNGWRDDGSVCAFYEAWPEQLERFAALVAADEREACASICFQEGPSLDGELIAEAIRARGNT